MGTNRKYLNYGEILRGETSKIFFERFLKVLTEKLEKFFGEYESKRILEAFGTGRINIIGLENFLHPDFEVNDKSLEIYRSCNSADEFFYKGLMYLKKQAETGNSHIVVREFILALMDMTKKSKYNISQEEIGTYIKTLFCFLSGTNCESPFYIQILDVRFQKLVHSKLSLSFVKYGEFMYEFFKVYKELHSQVKDVSTLPKVEIIYPVYPDVRNNQLQYLQKVFSIRKFHLNSIVGNIQDMSENSVKLNTVLDKLSQESGKEVNKESILLELQRIKELNPYNLYPSSVEFNEKFHFFKIPRSTISLKSINKYCMNQELMELGFGECYSNIEIDCEGLDRDSIVYFIDVAKNLTLTRVYSRNEGNLDANYRITLTNVDDLSHEFIEFIKKKMKQLKSSTNRNFFIDVKYKHETITQKFDKTKDPYIRVISDIHADYNRNQYSYNFGEDFVINCGDTAGEARTCIRWSNDHMRHGVLVAGNHLGYGKCYPDLDKMDIKNTKGKNINIIAANFTGSNSPIMFLSNTETEYEGVVILGTTLFTNFALYGEEHIEEAMSYAKKNMNDFKLITSPGNKSYIKQEDGYWFKDWKPGGTGGVRLFTPQDHAYYFEFSYEFLKKKVEKHKDKPIIIVTHHAPSPYSISQEYAGSMLNPAFASNLNEFIINNPQIRLWCHGHCIDDETEVLTTSGWKTFKNIKQSDILLNLNTLTTTIEEDTINAIISKNYSGEVYHFHSKGTDLRVTDEHDMLTIYRKTKKITKIKAKDLYNKKQKFLVRAGLRGNKGLNLSDNLLRLLVWISADGNRPNPNTNLIRFGLYKERKIERLKFILDELKIPFKKYVRKDGSQSINFYLPSELQDYSFKPIDSRITHCDKHQCRVILEEYAHTDGYKPYNSYTIYTSKKAEADSIQLMCITNEYGCSISTRINHGFKLKSGGDKVSYELNIVDNPYRCLDNPHRTVTVETVSNEHFWCLNTNNGTLIVRRNGKVNITGNCHNRSDYILGQTRVVCDPFGYNNENNADLPYNYGTRIRVADIKSKKPWTDICSEEIKFGLVKVYEK